MMVAGSGSASPRTGAHCGSGQTGAALLTVLIVLTVLGIAVTILMDRSRRDIRPWALESEAAQALYSAESGIAFQLYLERFSDSAEPSFGKGSDAPVNGNTDPFLGGSKTPADTFSYHLDSLGDVPVVRVDRSRSYLDMVSIGRFRNTEVSVTARFGKALDDSVFGPALTMDNTEPLESISAGQVIGTVRMRTPSTAIPSIPWPQGFTTSAYTAEFADKRYGALESALQKKLGEQGGEGGNGNFTRNAPPVFPAGGDLFFPLGRVELINDDDETWVLKGPGRILCDGEIRIKGLIRLENIQLLSGKDITFEDSITGDGITAFARGSVYFQNRCNLGIEAVAGKDIVLRNTCQTNPGSVLLSVGNRHLVKGTDSLNAIRIVNEAVARGFLIAGGPNGRVALANQANIVEGVVIAAAVWLAGEVRGPVLTSKLLCEGTNKRNCLGSGRINRNLLPANFVQPLQLGVQDRRLYVFKLMEWKRT